ncbi:MAG: ATP-binding protein [Bacteroidetes bacterium]|nr:ATP-binding protein [Bacteroidota bacterium]
MKRVLVTGPESTGKTEMVNWLSERFNGIAVEEYARAYVEDLDHPYNFGDVEHIARQQLSSYERDYPGTEWVFFDTWLMITRVWFEVVFKRVPQWLDSAIMGARFDLVLLCAPDIPWIPDGIRENGGIERDRLFEQYERELEHFGMDWELVSGSGEGRFKMAEETIYRKMGYGTI